MSFGPGAKMSPAAGRSARKRVSPNELWAKEVAAAKRRELEDVLAGQIKAHRLPRPEREHRFHEVRLWRFDFAWPEFMVAVEVDGASWIQGRHTRGAGFERDAEKLNAAAVAGWLVLRYTDVKVRSGFAVREIEDVLRKRRP